MPNTRIGSLIPGHTWLEGNGVPNNAFGSKFQYYKDNLLQDVYQKLTPFVWTKIGNLLGVGGWISGAGAPASNIGIIGNFYEDTVTGDVYEKTDATTWTPRGDLIAPVVAGIWTSGNGLPSNSLGSVGDFYEDKDNGNCYEKTAPTTWEFRFDAIPPPPITSGIWTSGSGLPAALFGSIGDFYNDVDTGDVYEKTDGTTWTLRGDLIPPTPIVPSGIWTSGNGVPAPAFGSFGNFYNDLDTGDVYEKTSPITWVLRGDLTPPSPVVTTGIWFSGSGAPTTGFGNIGDYYEDIDTKLVYQQTDIDVWTARGTLAGSGGIVAGTPWISGSGVPSGALSVIGAFYLNIDTWDIYEKTGASTWTMRGSVAPVNMVRNIIGSTFIQAGMTMEQRHIVLDTAAVVTVDGELNYHDMDTTNGTLDSTNGQVIVRSML